MGEAEERLRAHDQAELSLHRLCEAAHRLEDQLPGRAARVHVVSVAASGAANHCQLPVERRQLGVMPTQNTAEDSADPCRMPSSESLSRPATPSKRLRPVESCSLAIGA